MRRQPQAQRTWARRIVRRFLRDERGAIGVFFILSLPFMLGIGAIAVDVGFLWSMQAQLQATADASALAAVSKVSENGTAKSLAAEYAEKNMPTGKYGQVVTSADVIVGAWNPDDAQFSAGADTPNAVKVTAKMTSANGNPVKLFFAQVIGIKEADVVASTIAYMEASGGFCILGLDRNLAKTVEFRGNADVDLKCGIASNSNAGDAVAVIGSAPETPLPLPWSATWKFRARPNSSPTPYNPMRPRSRTHTRRWPCRVSTAAISTIIPPRKP